MFYIGRFLQIVGLGIAGMGCLVACDPKTPERTFWTFCLAGVLLFALGHWLIPKES